MTGVGVGFPSSHSQHFTPIIYEGADLPGRVSPLQATTTTMTHVNNNGQAPTTRKILVVTSYKENTATHRVTLTV